MVNKSQTPQDNKNQFIEIMQTNHQMSIITQHTNFKTDFKMKVR